MSPVIIRVDGSSRYGMGHVMRCVALAQALRARGEDVVFLMNKTSVAASAIVKAQRFDAVLFSGDAGASTVTTVRERGASRVVVDLAHIDTLSDRPAFVAFLDRLYQAGIATAVIEGSDAECFSHREVLPVSAVIVPYFAADTRKYLTLLGVKTYAGAQYFPFRPEFAAARAERQVPAQARRILVSFGGGDVARYNAKTIAAFALMGRSDLEIRVTGEVHAPYTKGKFQVIHSVADMAALIVWADLAIIGSGLTRYETALMGTPAVVYSLQAGHVSMVEEFVASGSIEHGGLIDDVPPSTMAAAISRLLGDHETRVRMASAGPQITDGRGAARLAEAIGRLAA